MNTRPQMLVVALVLTVAVLFGGTLILGASMFVWKAVFFVAKWGIIAAVLWMLGKWAWRKLI